MKLVILAGMFIGLSAFATSPFSSDIQKSLVQAKKSKRPLLISFHGIWCPACNELEETVFESSDFLQKAKKFQLLKVDADAKTSWALKDKYKVGGYPTVVFTNPQGDEIYRVIGYRKPREFFRVMDLVAGAKGKNLEASCTSKDVEDLWRCAFVCTERKDFACADGAYAKLQPSLKPGTVRYEQARLYGVQRAETDELKRDGYERLLAESADSPQALYWVLDYLKLFEGGEKKGPNKEVLEKLVANYPKHREDPRAEEAGVTLTDMAQIRAILLDKLGRPEEAKAAWKEAAALLDTLASEMKGTVARGFTLERISCLEESGDLEGALKLSNEYRKKFPKEFTFHYWSASLLERAKRYNEALPVAKEAYQFAYGDNKVRVGTLLVNLYATVPDKASAKQIYEEVTKEVAPEARLEVRTHRYLKKLEESYKEIAG